MADGGGFSRPIVFGRRHRSGEEGETQQSRSKRELVTFRVRKLVIKMGGRLCGSPVKFPERRECKQGSVQKQKPCWKVERGGE